MSNSAIVTFNVYDYKGSNTLSSYALSNLNLVFVPDTSKTVSSRLVWDFGDGTKSKSFSAIKSYDFPGEYTVSLFSYDCSNNVNVSVATQVVTIKDYFPYTFTVDITGGNITCKNGQITNIGTVEGYFPPYQPPSNIYYSVSGSKSDNYWNVESDKFAHLKKTYAVYDTLYNNSLSTFQYEEIKSLDLKAKPVFVKISNGAIVECDKGDDGAFWAGSKGEKLLYFRDDSIKETIHLKLFFDKNNTHIPIRYKGIEKIKHVNNLSVVLSASIVDNDEVDRASITSNGLDGDGTLIQSFNIDKVKYFDVDIPFVVKIKDELNFSVKNFSTLSLSTLNLSVIQAGGTLLSSAYYKVTDLKENYPGAFRGYISFPYSNVSILSGVKLATRFTIQSDQLSSYSISSISTPFNVYTRNYNDIYKKNENFDASGTISDLRFQEIMLDKNVFFDEFLGAALGNSESLHNSIGKKSYEKIANFVGNTQDIDTCVMDSIDSMGDFVGYEGIGEENYTFPENIKAWMNLASISKFNLVGTSNKFDENFDVRGRSSKDVYGVNLGNKINNTTYVVLSGVPIVALEKFSNTYVKINTEQPKLSSYPLSAYSSDWGWPLVLPSDFVFVDFPKYYIFFEYTEAQDNTLTGGVIDFDNIGTTLTQSATNNDLFGTTGLFEKIFSDTLYQSLSL